MYYYLHMSRDSVSPVCGMFLRRELNYLITYQIMMMFVEQLGLINTTLLHTLMAIHNIISLSEFHEYELAVFDCTANVQW